MQFILELLYNLFISFTNFISSFTIIRFFLDIIFCVLEFLIYLYNFVILAINFGLKEFEIIYKIVNFIESLFQNYFFFFKLSFFIINALLLFLIIFNYKLFLKYYNIDIKLYPRIDKTINTIFILLASFYNLVSLKYLINVYLVLIIYILIIDFTILLVKIINYFFNKYNDYVFK